MQTTLLGLAIALIIALVGALVGLDYALDNPPTSLLGQPTPPVP